MSPDEPHDHETPDQPPPVETGAPPVGEGRHHALDLRDAAEAAFVRGDYRMTRELDRQIEAMPGRTEPRREGAAAELGELATAAAKERRRLGMDPVAVLAGAFATLLYLLGWLLALR